MGVEEAKGRPSWEAGSVRPVSTQILTDLFIYLEGWVAEDKFHRTKRCEQVNSQMVNPEY